MRIDAEFLYDHVVVFHPQTQDEAAALQRALFALGPCWSTGIPEIKSTRELVREGMTVAQGQIFIGIDPRDARHAVPCTAADLGIAERPPAASRALRPPGVGAMKKETLTEAFLRANRVVFRPATTAEAKAIQLWMFRHGIYWKDGERAVWQPKRCVDDLMLIEHGVMFVKPDMAVAYHDGKVSDLDGICEDDYLTSEERMARKVDALTGEVAGLHAKVDRLLALLEPQVALKPALIRKPQGRTP